MICANDCDDADDHFFNCVVVAPEPTGPPRPPYRAAELAAYYEQIKDWWGE